MTKQMENAQLEVVSIGDQDLLASTPPLESHNESIAAEISNNNPGSESIEQTGCQTEATNNAQAQCPSPGMPVTKVQPFLSGKKKHKESCGLSWSVGQVEYHETKRKENPKTFMVQVS